MKTSRFRSRPRCPLSRSCCGKSGGSPPSDGVYRTAGSEGQEHRPRTGKERASARPGPAGVAAPDATPLAAYGRAGTAPGRGAWTAGGRGRHQHRPGDTVGRPATEPGVDPCPRRRSAGGSGPQGLRGRRRRGRQVRERRAASPSERTGPEAAGRGEESPRSRGTGAREPETAASREGREGGGHPGAAAGGSAGGRERSGPRKTLPGAVPPAHRASVLNDDLLGQHDTAVRGPFLLLPLGHFTILDSWRCCSHSRGGRPQRRVPSRHYCRAEPLGAPAAILRARPASGGASHRAIGRRARPAHVTPPRPRDAAPPARPPRGGARLSDPGPSEPLTSSLQPPSRPGAGARGSPP